MGAPLTTFLEGSFKGEAFLFFFFFLVLWTEGHWASEKGHQAEWADLLWKLIVEADIGLLNAQSRPRLCVFLILTSFVLGKLIDS